MKNHLFCIAHKDILFDKLPEGTKLICTGKYKSESLYNIIHSRKKLYHKYEFLAGTAGSFYINELLEDVDGNDTVTVFLYRKFVSQNLYGPLSCPQTDISNSDIKKNIDLEKELNSIGVDYLFPHPIYTQSTLWFYDRFHLIQDFLRFTACAVDVGVLRSSEVVDFYNFNMMIPGGAEVGKFPVSVYRELVTKLEMTTNLYLDTHDGITDMTGNQSRALSQCCERLGSWLLIKHLETKFAKPFLKQEGYFRFENSMVNKDDLNFNEFIGCLHNFI